MNRFIYSISGFALLVGTVLQSAILLQEGKKPDIGLDDKSDGKVVKPEIDVERLKISEEVERLTKALDATLQPCKTELKDLATIVENVALAERYSEIDESDEVDKKSRDKVEKNLKRLKKLQTLVYHLIEKLGPVDHALAAMVNRQEQEEKRKKAERARLEYEVKIISPKQDKAEEK